MLASIKDGLLLLNNMCKLEIPCSYQGGKQRLAKQIIDIIMSENEITENTKFYDLCCGSGAVSIELINRGFNPKNIHMVDLSPWGLVWRMIGDKTFNLGTFKAFIETIPKDITKIKQYAQDIIGNTVDTNMMPYHFLFLQSCAFGSTATWVENNKWCKAGGLRDYWLPTETSSRRSPVNPMMPMPNSLYNRLELLCNKTKGLHGYCTDVNEFYKTIEDDNVIIYIDPPYEGVQKYGYNCNIKNLIDRHKKYPLYISEGTILDNNKNCYLLSEERDKGNINGNSKKKHVKEWLNKF